MSSRPSLGYWLLFIVINIAISALTTWFVVRQLVPTPSTLAATGKTAVVVSATPPVIDTGNATPTSAPVGDNGSSSNGTSTPVESPTEGPTVAADNPNSPAPVNPNTSAISVRITAVIYPGQQSREVVVVVNESGDINLNNWTIVSPRGKIFTFGNLTLYKDSFINVYTRNGTNTATDLFWNQTEPMWQTGDEVQLKQGDKVIATYTVK